MSLTALILTTLLLLFLVSIASNIITQLLHRHHKSSISHRPPPIVWHLLPFIGSTVSYGQDPYAFFFQCRKTYGDIFTFTLIGMRVTVYLGTAGNNFILNGRHRDLNAEEIYGPLTVPIFGKGVVYDVDNARFMDQKRLLKEAFTSNSLRAYVPLFVEEVETYVAKNPVFAPPPVLKSSGLSSDSTNGARGDGWQICDISTVVSEIALYCAAASLQGPEVRERFDATFATLYRHLDDAFVPVNFMFPGLPLPLNRRRDRAQQTMAELYMDIIRKRRAMGKDGEGQTRTEESQSQGHDVLWALLDATYKDGTPLADAEIANLMIALLMGGQHNTAASGAWIMLHLANKPDLIEQLYAEQRTVLGTEMQELSYDAMQGLALHNAVIKETLRLHSPIHSVMRKVKNPMPIPNTDMVVPAGHILLAAPSFPSRCEEYFPNAMDWDPHRWVVGKGKVAPAVEGQTQEQQQADDSKIDFGFGAVSSKAASSPYLPFGAGRHRCVGETFAYAQLTAILATMVRLLQWKQIDPKADVPMTDYSSMFSRPVHPATIRWRRRV